MNQARIKTIQARMSLLISLLVLVAAANAVIGIVNAASFQQQMEELQSYTDALKSHAVARTSLLKSQIAVKNTFISNEDRNQDYADLDRYTARFGDYLYEQILRGSENDPTLAALDENAYRFDEQVSHFFDRLFASDSTAEELIGINLDQIDPIVAQMEQEIETISNQDNQAIRTRLDTIRQSTQTGLLAGQLGLLLIAVLLVWSIFTAIDISAPLQRLTGGIVAFENNVFKPALLAIDARRSDELGILTRAVSSMASSISESNRIQAQYIRSAQRFIPVQYLEFLEKDSITNVKLGDHVSAEMAVMFSDIRGFTTLSEKMTAHENFDFVNEYLSLVSPIIQKHEGFIVKFLGDGMMAIFPYGVDDAVQAGIEKERAVAQFNDMLRARGYPPIMVGIGIHTGPMMVGMIGEELRMQGDAFSDSVNLTSRLEGLNKFYGTSMIISGETLAQLSQPVTFKLRSLGKAVVKGRETPLTMYEVYEGLPAEAVACKELTRPVFEQAVQLFAKASFKEAGQLFSQALEADPSDKTIRMYLEQCAEQIDRPLPPGWNGAIQMESK